MSAPPPLHGAELLRAIPRLRPLPELARRVLQLVQDPDYAVEDLLAIVRTDPTLVARLLRLCNSASSALLREIHAIGDAVTFLGTRHLVQLVLATCSAATFTSPAAAAADGAAAWRHSLTTALASQRTAQALGPAAAARAFTVGVLHGIGELALGLCATPAHATALAAAPATMTTIERERAVLGIDHATAAGLVAAAWQLPGDLVVALRGHHDDTELAGDDPLAAVLHVGCAVASHVLAGTESCACATAALVRLGLAPGDLDAIAADTKDALRTHAELLNLVASARR